MPTEVFISRPVHDQLLEQYAGLFEEILAENPEPAWTLAGVKVTMSESLHRSYINALNGLVIILSAKIKQQEYQESNYVYKN
jgi:hypothetical protein